MTPQQAKLMMNNIFEDYKAGKAQAEDLVKACNSVARFSIDWALNAQKRDTFLLGEVKGIKKALGLEVSNGAAAAPKNGAAHAAPQTPGVPRGPNGFRLNVDGTEMDASQSANEDAMDAAINAGVQAGEIQVEAGHTPFTAPQGQAEAPIVVETAPDVPMVVPVPPPSAARSAAMDAAIRAQTK